MTIQITDSYEDTYEGLCNVFKSINGYKPSNIYGRWSEDEMLLWLDENKYDEFNDEDCESMFLDFAPQYRYDGPVLNSLADALRLAGVA